MQQQQHPSCTFLVRGNVNFSSSIVDDVPTTLKVARRSAKTLGQRSISLMLVIHLARPFLIHMHHGGDQYFLVCDWLSRICKATVRAPFIPPDAPKLG